MFHVFVTRSKTKKVHDTKGRNQGLIYSLIAFGFVVKQSSNKYKDKIQGRTKVVLSRLVWYFTATKVAWPKPNCVKVKMLLKLSICQFTTLMTDISCFRVFWGRTNNQFTFMMPYGKVISQSWITREQVNEILPRGRKLLVNYIID